MDFRERNVELGGGDRYRGLSDYYIRDLINSNMLLIIISHGGFCANINSNDTQRSTCTVMLCWSLP
jgi:hypothetical protein